MKTVMSIRIVNQDQKQVWDRCIYHPLQSWSWGEFRKSMGLDLVRLGYFENGKLISGWQITFHSIPHTSWTIAYIPKCPMPTPEIVNELQKLGKVKKSIYMQIEPDVNVDRKILISKVTNKSVSVAPNLNILVSQYPNLLPSHHPLFTKYTFLLDLTKSEDDLLASMHPKTRYNIKVAQKHGVEVNENNSNDAFNTYLRLTEETTNRQAFYAHSRDYHQKMWETMRDSGLARLFTATYQNQILAAWILFVWKDSLYYPYGASSRLYREVMAPTLLLWETALWGKKQGLTHYDLWGALGPNPDKNDPWYGFHRFKEGFNPTLVEFIGSFDLIINPTLFNLYKVVDSVRWKYLKLIKSFK